MSVSSEALLIESSFKGNTPSLEVDDSFDFVILKKTLKIHRSVLSKASALFLSLFKGVSSPLCKYNADIPQVEWIYEGAKTDSTYCGVLQTWLTFCYGKDVTFEAKELPAALAVLLQLRLTCMSEVQAKIEAKMKEVAEKNKEELGFPMLVECATVYDECHNESHIDMELAEIVLDLDIVKKNKEAMLEMAKKNVNVGGVMFVKVVNECFEKKDTSLIDVELAEAVLSCEMVNKNKPEMIEIAKKNVNFGAVMLVKCAKEKESRVDAGFVRTVLALEKMKIFKEVLVDKCLLNLPEEYLDVVEFSKSHDDLSEFSVRLKYVKFHDKVLSEEKKRAIMSKCNLGKLNNEELRELYKMGMFNDFAFVEQCHEETMKERDADRVRIQKLESEVEELKAMIKGLGTKVATVFPRTSITLNMGGHDQKGIESHDGYAYNIPETVIKLVEHSNIGDLRYDSKTRQLFVGSTGRYLITGRVALRNSVCRDALMNAMVSRNEGGPGNYVTFSNLCESDDNHAAYVAIHDVMDMNAGDYFTFKCNVTKQSVKRSVEINGDIDVTRICVTRIA